MNVIQRFSRPIPPFQTGVKSFEIPLQPQLFSIDSFIIHKYLKLLENLIVFGIIKKVYKNKGSETAFFLQFLTALDIDQKQKNQNPIYQGFDSFLDCEIKKWRTSINVILTLFSIFENYLKSDLVAMNFRLKYSPRHCKA